MPFIFPDRTNTSTAQQHLDDHNLLASLLDRAGGYTLSSSAQEHLDEHNAIHPDFGLAGRSLATDATTHLADHGTLHADLVTMYAGIRGTAGPRASTSIPEWPGSFAATIDPGVSTIHTAITNGVANDKFRLTAGTYNITTRIEPKAGQEFWCENGVIINGNGLSQIFHDLGGRDGVKIMNATMTGPLAAGGIAVNQPRATTSSSNWVVAYCDISTGANAGSYAINCWDGAWIHHNYLHGCNDGPIGGMWAFDLLIEDNMIGEVTGTPTTGSSNGFKMSHAKNCIVRHNRCRNNRPGIWYDHLNDGVIEWNLCEDSNGFGIDCEINGPRGSGRTGYAFPITDTTMGPPVIVRYNYVRNNQQSGLRLQTTLLTEVYGNVFENNGLSSPTNYPEIFLYYEYLRHTGGNTALDLKDNYIHNNIITPQATGRAAYIGMANGGGGDEGTTVPSQATCDPWIVTNTQHNDFDFNTYNLAALTDTRFATYWQQGTSNNKNWTQWQAFPITSGGYFGLASGTTEAHGEANDV